MARHGLDPGAPRFEELQRAHETRLEKARDADGLLRALAGTCAKALDCEGMTAFLRMGNSAWRLAYQSGTPICGEEHARAWTDFSVCIEQDEATSVANVGRYHDQLRREGDRWRFAERVVVMAGAEPPDGVPAPPSF